MLTQPLPYGVRTDRFEQFAPDIQRAELARLPIELRLERSWLESANVKPYANKADILGDIALGELVRVASGDSLPIRQYYQNRDSVEAITKLDEHACSVPYLRPAALAVMMRVAANARERMLDSADGSAYMREFGLANVQYSVTSMTRSRIYQGKLVAENALAFDGDSAHVFGVAFDIDHSGYYAQRKSGERLSVNGLSHATLYADVVIHSFHAALVAAASRDDLAFITELPQGRGCWHITANPALTEEVPASELLQVGKC